jgi:hypothetical protein
VAGCSSWKNRMPAPDGPGATGCDILDDWHSPELEQFLSGLPSATNKVQLALCPVQSLEHHWVDDGYADCLTASIRTTVAGNDCGVPSSFVRALKDTHWLPAEQGSCLAAPTVLWAHCDAVRQIFGPLDILYMDRALGVGSGRFILDLGVQVRPTVRGCFANS